MTRVPIFGICPGRPGLYDLDVQVVRHGALGESHEPYSTLISGSWAHIGVRGFPYGIFDPCTPWDGAWMGWESLSAAAVAVARPLLYSVDYYIYIYNYIKL